MGSATTAVMVVEMLQLLLVTELLNHQQGFKPQLRHGLAADPQNLSGINTKILMGKYITKTHYPFPTHLKLNIACTQHPKEAYLVQLIPSHQLSQPPPFGLLPIQQGSEFALTDPG